MAFHHLAFATRNLDETHAFYTDVMGFTLVKAVANETPDGGWAKHVFYDTGQGELIAFWDLHDDTIGEFGTAISEGLGLPAWVNHVAFAAASLDGLVCALLLKELDLIDDITFVHPKDVQDGTVAIGERDITTNLPYQPGAHLVFDHHFSETIRTSGRADNHVIDPDAPSAARVVY